MSYLELLDRYSKYSMDLMAEDPKQRANGIRKFVELYHQAPELRHSILIKLEQTTGDADESVAKLATQMLDRLQSGKQESPYYSPTRPTPSMRKESQKGDYPLWENWYGIVGPLNKMLAPIIIGLSMLNWLLYSWICLPIPGCLFYPIILVYELPWLIIGIITGILYLNLVQKPLAHHNLTKKMHIGLIICEILCWMGWWVIGAIMTLQFIIVGILSDKPFWEALKE